MQFIIDRIHTRAFWRTGVVVAGLFVTLLGCQFYSWSQAMDMALSEARTQARAHYPNQAQLFEAWDQCDRGLGAYAGTGILLQSDCDAAVIADAPDKAAAVAALQAQSEAIGKVAEEVVKPAWPLSVMLQLLFYAITRQ